MILLKKLNHAFDFELMLIHLRTEFERHVMLCFHANCLCLMLKIHSLSKDLNL